MVKGCEHTYCVTCILRWASCKESPTCPQCKHPFDFLSVHRTLDGSIEDFLFEESVCLLLRASWFIPLDVMVEQASYSYGYHHDDFDIPCDYDEDDDLDELYMHGSGLRIGNRRWGDNGFVRSGRQEARPVKKHSGSGSSSSSGSSSCEPKDKQVKTTNTTGRRAKRAMKREAANKAAEVASAAKHEAHLVRAKPAGMVQMAKVTCPRRGLKLALTGSSTKLMSHILWEANKNSWQVLVVTTITNFTIAAKPKMMTLSW
ncbi:hypothetical protein F2Q69_00000812 [Brassica cretica]|uniref:RING-type domain-containing protein n=1 Tax=Brassica cretica TaxID=69181 RepID=A0A8S9P7Z7_BRACR|nr:hypothetical protein F2Q69_00000812 [Brassica cretica]